MRRESARHESGLAARSAGVQSGTYWEHQPGARVMTSDGFPGRVTAVLDGPYPGYEEYTVELDGGLGGGAYVAGQLRPLASAPATAAVDHEASGLHTADLDYPELGSILTDRPDPAHHVASLRAPQHLEDDPAWTHHEFGGEGIRAHASASREETGDRWHEFRNRYQPDTIHRGLIMDLPSDVHRRVHDPERSLEYRARELAGHLKAERGLGMHWTPHIDIAHRSVSNAAAGSNYDSGYDQYGDEDDEGEYGGYAAPRTDVIIHARQPGQRNIVRNPQILHESEIGHQYSGDEDEVPLKPGAPVRITGISWKQHDPDYPMEPYEHHDFEKAVRHEATTVNGTEIDGHGDAPHEVRAAEPNSYDGRSTEGDGDEHMNSPLKKSDPKKYDGASVMGYPASPAGSGPPPVMGAAHVPWTPEQRRQMEELGTFIPEDELTKQAAGVPFYPEQSAETVRAHMQKHHGPADPSIPDDELAYVHMDAHDPASGGYDQPSHTHHAEAEASAMAPSLSPAAGGIHWPSYNEIPEHERGPSPLRSSEFRPVQDYVHLSSLGRMDERMAERHLLQQHGWTPANIRNQEEIGNLLSDTHAGLHDAGLASHSHDGGYDEDTERGLCAYQHDGPCDHPGDGLHEAESLRHPRPENFHSGISVNKEPTPRDPETHHLHGYLDGKPVGRIAFDQSDDGRAVHVGMLHTSGTKGRGIASAMMDDLYHHVKSKNGYIDHGWRTGAGLNWWNSYREPHPELSTHNTQPSNDPGSWADYFNPHDVARDMEKNHYRDPDQKHQGAHFNPREFHDYTPYEQWKHADDQWEHADDNVSGINTPEDKDDDDGSWAQRSAALIVEAATDHEARFEVTATWQDVLAKAARIRREGHVRITFASKGMVIGEVQGDHHVYETGIQSMPGGPASIGHWSCGCKWASYHQASLAKHAGMPRPDYDPGAELPEGRGIFYRAHDMRRPLDEQHARSAPLNHGYRPFQVNPAFSTGQRGYSAFASPHELSSYMDEMGWKEAPDWKHRNAIAFHGKEVGRGEDSEPLVVPEANPHCCGRVIHSKMPWDDFEGKLWHGDYTDPESHKYHSSQELWRENNQGHELSERRLRDIYRRSPEQNSERRYREKEERRNMRTAARRPRSYSGRPCSHVMALHLESQSRGAGGRALGPGGGVDAKRPKWVPSKVVVKWDIDDDRNQFAKSSSRERTFAGHLASVLLARGEDPQSVALMFRCAGIDLPYMPGPDDGQMGEHLHQRHGMDPENLPHGDARHWRRWHDSEHHYLTRNDHQHAVPLGHPLEEEYPAAHVVPDDASDVMGISGGHSTREWQDVSGTGPFIPDSPHYSARRTAPLSWDEIGERHPDIYGDPEVHGEHVQGDGYGIGDAANQLANDRPEDPDAENSGSWDLSFHPEHVPVRSIDYARHEPGDPRVAEARRGYARPGPEPRDPTEGVPPLVLVHRHGVYQVADGHHRAQGAHQAGRRKVRAYVHYSEHPDTPFSENEDEDQRFAPFHGARPHPGVAAHRDFFKSAAANDPFGGSNTMVETPGKPYGATSPPNKWESPASAGFLAQGDPENWGSIEQFPAASTGTSHSGVILQPPVQPQDGIPDEPENMSHAGPAGGASSAMAPKDPSGMSATSALRAFWAVDIGTMDDGGTGHDPVDYTNGAQLDTAVLHDHPEGALPSAEGVVAALWHVAMGPGDQGDQMDSTSATGEPVGLESSNPDIGAADPEPIAPAGNSATPLASPGMTPQTMQLPPTIAGLDDELGLMATPADEQSGFEPDDTAGQDEARPSMSVYSNASQVPQVPDGGGGYPGGDFGGPGAGDSDESLSPDDMSIQTVGLARPDLYPGARGPGRGASQGPSKSAAVQESGGNDEILDLDPSDLLGDNTDGTGQQVSLAAHGLPYRGSDTSDSDIAKAARLHLQKLGMDTFSDHEARQLISEGQGQRARNLDRLDLSGTHYLKLEAELRERGADDVEDDLMWV